MLLMAPATDPAFGYCWLQHHPGTVAEKNEMTWPWTGAEVLGLKQCSLGQLAL